MSLERMRPYIIRRLKLMYKTSFESLNEKTTLEELNQIVMGDKEILLTFVPVLEPNKYMNAVYGYLSQFGAGSVTYMVKWYKKRQRGKKKLVDDTLRKGIEDEIKYLELLQLITKEVLYYTWPSQTSIWIARWASEKQTETAIANYPYKEGFEKRRSKDYNHNKAIKDNKEPAEKVIKEEDKDNLYFCPKWRDHHGDIQWYDEKAYLKNNGECVNCQALLQPKEA